MATSTGFQFRSSTSLGGGNSSTIGMMPAHRGWEAASFGQIGQQPAVERAFLLSLIPPRSRRRTFLLATSSNDHPSSTFQHSVGQLVLIRASQRLSGTIHSSFSCSRRSLKSRTLSLSTTMLLSGTFSRNLSTHQLACWRKNGLTRCARLEWLLASSSTVAPCSRWPMLFNFLSAAIC